MNDIHAMPDGSVFVPLPPGPVVQCCTRCAGIFPSSEFRYRLTRQQALARGHKAQHTVVQESNLCTACRPKQRKLSELNAFELKGRFAAGDLTPGQMAAEQARRKQRNRKAPQQAAAKRWAKHAKLAWGGVLEVLRAERSNTKAKLHNYRKRSKYTDPSLVVFTEAYLVAVSGVVHYIRQHLQRRLPKPDEYAWPRLVDPGTVTWLAELWEAVPIAVRERLKVPLLVCPDAWGSAAVPAYEIPEFARRKEVTAMVRAVRRTGNSHQVADKTSTSRSTKGKRHARTDK